ncbi:isochorismate synthase DhbC [Thermoactinomyces sp. DSM 45892]|uniref:isochorismate synthase DhbC n=1 Tax=Thermoactinomyces sp. DSM 45892 TaxID=1882753 RepID=UPI000B864C99|nr:isochorismate synthase DhbC [Thermoactinomyces sp. DSM 45892]
MVNRMVQEEVKEESLLDDYVAGDFYFASPRNVVHGTGVFERIVNGGEVAHLVKQALSNARGQGHEHPVVVGAIPFDRQNELQLVIPEKCVFSDPYQYEKGLGEEFSPLLQYETEPVPAPEMYLAGVDKGLSGIAKGDFDKVVLSRSVRVHTTEPIDPKGIMQKLAHYNPQGFTFAVDVKSKETAEGKQKTFLGASPELLVSKLRHTVIANPLAGSRPRSEDPIEDERRAQELLRSEKDLHEHRIVVEAVKVALQPLCRNLEVPGRPTLIQTETMWHLSTVVKGEVLDDSISSLDLALALHPTPAVCGYPTERAFQAIQEIEPFDRGYFTGMVGWCDESGDGEWAVAIRCAELEGSSMSLYAGAGVVAGSKPEDELAETSAKMRTMLYAMGIGTKAL